MNRKSPAIIVAKFISNLPFQIFHPLEGLVLNLFPLRKRSYQLFLLAIPRSGSTLAHQCLVNYFSLSYLTNIGHVFYKLPFFGGVFSIFLTSFFGRSSTFTSQEGFISGFNSPSEGLLFWNWWMNFGLEDCFKVNKVASKMKAKESYFINVIIKLSSLFSPFSSSYLGHTLDPDRLYSHFPNAIYVRLRRDPVLNAMSLLECLRRDNRSWFSLVPRECFPDLHSSTEFEKVASQVYWLNKRLDDSLVNKNCLHINYEDLCSNPRVVMQCVSRYAESHGLYLKQNLHVPISFSSKSLESYSSSDVTSVRCCIKRLERLHGPLSSAVI